MSPNIKGIMRKIVYLIALSLSITITSCTTIMESIPGVYTLDIQQGNVIDQDMIDQLKPGMTKRQVLYIMGSSMLQDVFHQKRWDYLYSEQLDGGLRQQKKVSLYFNGDLLSGIQGDFRPSTEPVVRKSKEETVDVPERDLDKTLWGRMKSFFSDDNSSKKKQARNKNQSGKYEKSIRDKITDVDGNENTGL